VVGAGALHAVPAVLDAAPEVAAADDDADLHAHVGAGLDGRADPVDDVEVEAAALPAGEGFAADFQKYAFINRFFIHCNSPFQSFPRVSRARL